MATIYACLVLVCCLTTVALAGSPSSSQSQSQDASSGACSHHTSSFAYIIERTKGVIPYHVKADVCGECSDSMCVVEFADSPAAASQHLRLQAMNAAWKQLQRTESSRSAPLQHYILIIDGANLNTSIPTDSPPTFSALLRSFERALLAADFSVAVPSLHALPKNSRAIANSTSSVLNPFASGIIAVKAHAAPDLFPLLSASSHSSAAGSSDVGYALAAASVIAHRRFGDDFISLSYYHVQWMRPPPFGIGPSSFLLTAPTHHALLCSLYDSFALHANGSTQARSSDELLQDAFQAPAFVSNNSTASPLRAPNCCHFYWQQRSACASFTSRDACPVLSLPTACHLPVHHVSHRWSATSDAHAPSSDSKRSYHYASLPFSALSFSSVFCHDVDTGVCICSDGFKHCDRLGLRYPQLESMTAWTPAEKDKSPWMQMDFGQVTKMLGVITRARRDEHQWVRDYRITISNVSSSSLIAWIEVGTFLGNIDPYNDKINMFQNPVLARYVRLYPISFFSHRSIRADIIVDSHIHTNQVYHMPHLLPPPALPLIQSFRGKRILMIGDSHTRFHYLHLAHWFCFQQQAGKKFVEDMFWQKGTLQWQTYDEKWDEFFRESTFAFDGNQMCDCHRPASWREFGYEMRVTRCADVEITFVLMYGAKNVLGRLPLDLGDFELLAQARAINSVMRCTPDNRGCPKGGCVDAQKLGELQAEVEELKAKLMVQVLSGEIDSNDMFDILESFEKSKAGPPPRVCKGSGGYAWHDAMYGKTGNGGVWEYANLSHFLKEWSAATGGADVYFIGQGAHLDFSHSDHIESILSSCSLAKKNLSSSRCIWRSPTKKEVHFSQVSSVDAMSSAIQSLVSTTGETNVTAEWSVFRPDDLLHRTPPEFYVDSVGHFSGAANDILNNGFLWFLWSLVGESK